jgi:UDPglucose 6-dehydrogenase
VRVSIVGTGYVGLVTGVCLAELGHEVVCVDIDESKVRRINDGDAPIYEAGLDELLRKAAGVRLSATTDLRAAVAATEVTIVAVGTPYGEDRIDLGQIEAAAERVGAALREVDRYHVVVVKSTVVPGTTEEVVGPALEQASGRRLGRDIGLAMNPEFLREGVAVSDFLAPDRIVLGGIDERTLETLDELYSVFDDTPIVRVDPRTAEMVKYASNALLASLISFSNEVANLCAQVGVDVVDVLQGVHLDRRLSPVVAGTRVAPGILAFIAAGCGFGGSCFPKDVKALVSYGESAGVTMSLLQAVLATNAAQPEVLVQRLQRHMDLSGRKVAVLGAAFKPGTDDVRESPSLVIVPRLRELGADVVVHDPIAIDNCRAALDDADVSFTDVLEDALDGADAVVIVTAWPEYERVPSALDGQHPLVLDGRRMLSPDSVQKYEGIGFPNQPAPAASR